MDLITISSKAASKTLENAVARSVPIRVRYAMRIAFYSDLRRNLAAALDRVGADREPLVITRDRASRLAVLMSLGISPPDEETRHLLRSRANAEQLLKSIAEMLEKGEGRRKRRSWSEADIQRREPGANPISTGRRVDPEPLARAAPSPH